MMPRARSMPPSGPVAWSGHRSVAFIMNSNNSSITARLPIGPGALKLATKKLACQY